jgi:hypothetical protein
MDVAYVSALSALAGSVVGGLTSGFTTWLSQRPGQGWATRPRSVARAEQNDPGVAATNEERHGDRSAEGLRRGRARGAADVFLAIVQRLPYSATGVGRCLCKVPRRRNVFSAAAIGMTRTPRPPPRQCPLQEPRRLRRGRRRGRGERPSAARVVRRGCRARHQPGRRAQSARRRHHPRGELGLEGRVRLDTRGISSRDWESYPVLRFSEVPEVLVELVNPSADLPPLGVGEASGGPTVAAIGNAVAHALGACLRDLPLTRDRVMPALLQA